MKKSNLILLSTIIFIILIIAYSFLRDNIRSRKLENTIKTHAVFIENLERTSADPSGGIFEYQIKGKFYKFHQQGDFSNLEIGDTVEIKYSIQDNSVAEITNTHYMDRYK